MPKRDREDDDYDENNHNRKRQKTGHHRSQRSTGHRSSTQYSQIPGLMSNYTQSNHTQNNNGNKKRSGKTNKFYDMMKMCNVRFRSNTEHPLELDSPQTIELYLQRKLQRDDFGKQAFIKGIEDFIELEEGKRFNQLLLNTKPRRNKSHNRYLTERWKEMSQINEDDIQSIAVRKQPSMIRMLLNVDCIQEDIIQLLFDKLDDILIEEVHRDLVGTILEQFKFLDHLVYDPQKFVERLFDILEIGNDTEIQRGIISLFDEIIHDDQHQFVAEKLLKLLENRIELTQTIIPCLAQLKMSENLKQETQRHLLDSLQTSKVEDLEYVVRYLLRTVSSDDALDVLTKMRANMSFRSKYNFEVFLAFTQCLPIQKFVSTTILKIIEDCNNKENKLYPIDLWLLFILYDKTSLSNKVESVIIKKIDIFNKQYIIDSLAINNRKYGDVNIKCLINVYQSILYLAQTMLENKNKSVSKMGKLLYKILFQAMNNKKSNDNISYNKHQQELISSITQQIGSGTKTEVNNSLNLLFELTKENSKTMKSHQTPIMHLVDYIEGFDKPQIRLLYQILSLLSINVDSNQELQIGGKLSVLITKQMGHSGYTRHQEAGVIGCIQLIHAISTEIAHKTKNGTKEGLEWTKKLIQSVATSHELFATMLDEVSLMIENSRIASNENVVSWSKYVCDGDSDDESDDSLSSDDEDFEMNNNQRRKRKSIMNKISNGHNNNQFYPIHRKILQQFYNTTQGMISEQWAIRDNDGSRISQSTQKENYKRQGLKPAMWLDLSGKKRRNRNANAIDSEATEFTDNDELSCNDSSCIIIRITPIFLLQSSEKLMWVFSPLFRLYGILSNAIHGDLERIEGFLTAPFVMFDESDLEDLYVMDQSKVTRQIMGDSMFSAINCVRELLNMFCGEYVEFCRIKENGNQDDMDQDGDDHQHNHNIDSSQANKMNKLEQRLCLRIDHLVALEMKLQKFMKVNINKEFLPSFIPSENQEQTWLNSPPWKRKLMSNDKENKNKNRNKNKKNTEKKVEDEEEVDTDNPMIDEGDDEEETRSKKKKKNKNKSKKKNGKSPKRSKSKSPSKRKKKTSPKRKTKKKSPSKPKPKKKAPTKERNPLERVESYFRPLDLSVAVVLKFSILDQHFHQEAEKRLESVSECKRDFRKKITLKGFKKILKDFCDKTIEIIDNQSARKGFSSKEVTESIADYTPSILIKRYGFIFKYISNSIHELIKFRQRIYENLDSGELEEDDIAYLKKSVPIIQDCWHIFIKVLIKLWKYKQFESSPNKKVFKQLLNYLYIAELDCDRVQDPFGKSDTRICKTILKALQTMLEFVEDFKIAINIIQLFEVIVKHSTFDKNIRIDYKKKIANFCEKILMGEIGDGYINDKINASNLGVIVTILLRHCEKPLQLIDKFLSAINGIESNTDNPYSMLKKKSYPHFIKPMLESLCNVYSSLKPRTDAQLKQHENCIQKLNEIAIIVKNEESPRSTGFLFQYSQTITTKCVSKMGKMSDNVGTKNVIKHLSTFQIISQRLVRISEQCKTNLIGDKSKSIKNQWMRVIDKVPRLLKSLDDLVLKTKAYAHSKGQGDKFVIRRLSKTFGVKKESRYVQDNNDDDDEEEEEDEESDGSEDADSSESD